MPFRSAHFPIPATQFVLNALFLTTHSNGILTRDRCRLSCLFAVSDFKRSPLFSVLVVLHLQVPAFSSTPADAQYVCNYATGAHTPVYN